ncbi:MAG: hypothetical protein LQ349_003142 [Xanthoria aureola]|nr:MAG: hypothetical protein LQ349_005112 [Xanthoria aureola]KAI4235474.1 MAG: hypothetical protein LQ349_003142 [Xanthoria aureola]
MVSTRAFRQAHRYLLILLHLNLLFATPLKPTAKAPPPATLNGSRTGNDSILPKPSYPKVNEDVRLIHYDVPHTNINIDILLFLSEPLDREALGRTLNHAISWIGTRLQNQGDDWLAKDDNPFYSTAQGKVFLRIDSLKTPNGRSMLTYRTLLAVFGGLWTELFVGKEPWAASFRINVAGITAAHGALAGHGLEKTH